MRRLRWLGLAVGFLTFPVMALAQDMNLSTPNAPVVNAPVIPGPPGTAAQGTGSAPDGWGTTAHQVTWYGASKFTVRLSSSAPVLTYAGVHYYNSPGSSGPTRYFAQLDLDPGSKVDVIVPVYNDNSATNDINWSLQKYTTDVTTGSSSSVALGAGNTTGSPGFSFTNSSIVPNEVITTLSGVTLTNYYLAIDIASDTSFAGFWVGWKRTVSPGPATATFTDVPTTSGQFKFVEALVAAGVTAGCGGGNFCPNDPVTRGQMAVFLASALGMQFIQ